MCQPLAACEAVLERWLIISRSCSDCREQVERAPIGLGHVARYELHAAVKVGDEGAVSGKAIKLGHDEPCPVQRAGRQSSRKLRPRCLGAPKPHLAGTAAMNGTGNSIATKIAGSAGNKVLLGGGGNDTIGGARGTTFSMARKQ
jgi:hypothetical protein